MPKIVILGSANAIPDEKHENTHMAVVGEERMVLIDCPGNPVVRLREAGLGMERLTDLILTHFHPDHVSGVPLLLMDMWLLGRQQPLNIYGLSHTLERVQNLMNSYDWDTWPHFFPVIFNRIPARPLHPVMECEEWRIFSSPVHHMIPNIGLRIELLQTNKVIAYSCDTEPCPQVVQLARNADVLIHEASGNSPGHTSPTQAGDIAQEANVRALYLIHYPTNNSYVRGLIAEAAKSFAGPVVMAEDFMELKF